MRKGVTLIELVIILTIVGTVMGLAAPRAATWLDRLAVDRAAMELVSFYHEARFGAIRRAARVRVLFAEDSLRAHFEDLRDSAFVVRPGPGRHGVRLLATRREIEFYPTGIGLGGANTKLVLQRGAVAESLTTSRLGRLKRWR